MCINLNLVFIQQGLWVLIIPNMSGFVLEMELEWNPSHHSKQGKEEDLKVHLIFQISCII